MFEQRQRRSRQGEQAAEVASQTGTDPAVIAASASVLMAWYEYFVRGDKALGLFIGLWPPTIFAFSSYFNQTRMSDQLRRLM